jgi:very-short-patch-repair endonuclease
MADESVPPSVPTWAGLPLAGAIRVVGVDRAALSLSLDPLPHDAPAVIGCSIVAVESADSPAQVVDEVLGQLETVARAVFPAWLPGGEHLHDATAFERRTARRLAESIAARSTHYGPFLAALADGALAGLPADGYPADVRARGLTRVVASAYRRDHLAILLDCTGALDDRGRTCVAAAVSWLADHCSAGIWLVGDELAGDELAGLDRFPARRPTLPAFVQRLTAAPSSPAPPPEYPAVAGRPHPRSDAERELEASLAQCAWAEGRTWNQVHQPHPLDVPIRVDLMWPDARCVVEIDGPDHRGALKYADDRRRDNALVLDGYAVLRFTNDDVHRDTANVLTTIRRLLIDRRQKGNAS